MLQISNAESFQLCNQIFKTIPVPPPAPLFSFPVLLHLLCIHFVINKFSDFLPTSVKYLQVHELISMPVRETKVLPILQMIILN